MNKKIASELAVGIILLIAIPVGGLFYFQSQKESAIRSQKPVIGNQPIKSEAKMQSAINQPPAQVLQGYKLIKVSDGETAFSFGIPENWLVETRQSGEKQLAAEEIRNFLMTDRNGDDNPDYFPIDMKKIEKATSKQLEDLYFRGTWGSSVSTVSFHTASVTPNNIIRYGVGLGEDYWKQVNFELIDKTAENIFKESKNGFESNCRNGNIDCSTLVFPTMEQISFGDKQVYEIKGIDSDIENHYYYIETSNPDKTLSITVRFKRGDPFEEDFKNLIQSLNFE